ncbi:unnamed protein product [Acidithrix sp. C25]|nr:unnamed protein product [Acidithrix sp. C25]
MLIEIDLKVFIGQGYFDFLEGFNRMNLNLIVAWKALILFC